MGMISDFLFFVEKTRTNINGLLTGKNGEIVSTTIDTGALTNKNDHVPSSAAVKSAFADIGLMTGGLWDAQKLAPPTGTTPDLNNITTSGFVAVGVGTLNAPYSSGGNFGICFTTVYLSSPLRAFQIALWIESNFGIYYRSCMNGTWGNWVKVATS